MTLRPPDAQYTIRLAARMTGVSEHTLRAWERRYGFPRPFRTQGGARRYDDEQIARLKLIARAIRAGFRAGDVVGKSDGDLSSLLAKEASPEPVNATVDLEDTFRLMAADNVTGLQDQIRQYVALLGPRRFVSEFVSPLLTQVGERWRAGEVTIQSEHVLSELIDSQLRTLRMGYDVRDGRPRVLLTTLPDEIHRLGLEMAGLYLATRGVSLRMLGTSMPVSNLVDAAVRHKVDVIGLSVTEFMDVDSLRESVKLLVGELPRRIAVWVGGAGAAHISGIDAELAPDWEALDSLVDAWRKKH